MTFCQCPTTVFGGEPHCREIATVTIRGVDYCTPCAQIAVVRVMELEAA